MPVAHFLEMDRVELAFCGAQAAADAKIAVDLRRAAAEAAGALFAHLLFRERDARVGECLGLGGVVARRLAVILRIIVMQLNQHQVNTKTIPTVFLLYLLILQVIILL